jgi:hypothetical protein
MKNQTIIIVALIGLAVAFLVLGAICVGTLVLLVGKASASVSPAVDQIFADLDRDPGQAYDNHTSAEFRRATSRDEFITLGQRIKTRLGKLQSKSMRHLHSRQVNANSFTDVTYQATFEEGTGTISLRLQAEGDRWVLVSFQVNSPEFDKDAATGKCPHCGQPHPQKAQFCPQCGKELTATIKEVATEPQAEEAAK